SIDAALKRDVAQVLARPEVGRPSARVEQSRAAQSGPIGVHDALQVCGACLLEPDMHEDDGTAAGHPPGPLRALAAGNVSAARPPGFRGSRYRLPSTRTRSADLVGSLRAMRDRSRPMRPRFATTSRTAASIATAASARSSGGIRSG